jgi:hypothetical protein
MKIPLMNAVDLDIRLPNEKNFLRVMTSKHFPANVIKFGHKNTQTKSQ